MMLPEPGLRSALGAMAALEATCSEVIHSGPLTKMARGRSARGRMSLMIKSSWRRRHFVLARTSGKDPRLVYYKQEGKRLTLKGVLDLVGATVKVINATGVPEDGARPFSFELRALDEEGPVDMMLSAPDKASMDDWIRSLVATGQDSDENITQLTTVEDPPAPVSTDVPRHVDREAHVDRGVEVDRENAEAKLKKLIVQSAVKTQTSPDDEEDDPDEERRTDACMKDFMAKLGIDPALLAAMNAAPV